MHINTLYVCVFYRHPLYLAYCVVLNISYGMYIKNQDAKNILCSRFLGVKKKKETWQIAVKRSRSAFGAGIQTNLHRGTFNNLEGLGFLTHIRDTSLAKDLSAGFMILPIPEHNRFGQLLVDHDRDRILCRVKELSQLLTAAIWQRVAEFIRYTLHAEFVLGSVAAIVRNP
jgi:hypothetical protein